MAQRFKVYQETTDSGTVYSFWIFGEDWEGQKQCYPFCYTTINNNPI